MRDVLVALLSQLDVLGGAIIALNYGFLIFPSAIGYIAGALGSLMTGSVTPVSFMYESLILSYGLSHKLRERITMILIAAAITGIFGVFGLPQYIVNSIGQDVFLAMLAGVGIYLAKVGLEISQQDKLIGIPCFIAAIITQLVTNDLIWTVSVSIPLGFVIRWFMLHRGIKYRPNTVSSPKYSSWWDMVRHETKLIRPVYNLRVLFGSLALSTLTIGGNVAYVGSTLEMTKTAPTYDQATVISGIADYASSLFGGANMELIISPTAAAPHPLTAAVLYMSVAACILLSGVVYRISKWLPLSAMGGYLFVIGALLILPYNAAESLKTGNPIIVGLVISITALTNPFFGMVSGLVAKVFLFGN